MFGFAMSILARNTIEPSSNSPAVHLVEQLQVLFDRAVTVGTVCSRLCRCPLLGGDLFGSLLVDVCFSLLDQLDSEVPELLEVVGCVIYVIPVVTQPFDVFFDGVHIFQIFFTGLVSSKRRLQTPPYFCAMPKSRQMALACPICRYPFGSGGKRVCTRPLFLPSAKSFSTIASMKFKLFLPSSSFVLISLIFVVNLSIQSLQR